MTPRMPPVAVFRNNLALLAWMFTGAWVSMASVVTWLILRAPAENYTPLQRILIVAFLWLLNVAVLVVFGRRRLLRVAVDGTGGLDVRHWGLFGAERRRIEARDVRRAILVAVPDGADSVYYRCQVTLADGSVLELAEKRRTEPVQACADRFNAATGQVPER
jgi:hypothetical protein